MVITRSNAVHALLYLVVSFLSASFLFFLFGAPFVAALEVIIYAGAIMVLFVFVIMMLNIGKTAAKIERSVFEAKAWIGPAVLVLIIAAELMYVVLGSGMKVVSVTNVSPQKVAINLYGPYLIGVELAALLLLSGMVGAYHLGRRKRTVVHRFLRENER